MIWYKVGSADETPGKSGLAHFLEHLMFKGTEKRPAGEFSKVVQRLGGNENASTSTDYTNYFQRGPRDKLATLMEYEADRMTGLTLKDSEVLPERDVVLEEYNMRVANSPDARLSEQISAALYLNHPYGRPVIGWRHEIEQLNREDALAFYKRFYAPNNAIVVIAGDVATEEVRTLAEKFYGPLVAQPSIPAKRMRPQEPVPISPRTVTFADPRVEQPTCAAPISSPPRQRRKRAKAPRSKCSAQILGGGPSSYLYKSLVIDKKIAVGAGAWYQGTALDPTPVRRLGDAAAGHRVPANRSRARRGDRRCHRQRRQGRRSRTHQDAADRGDDLRPGQSGHIGAMVRRLADGGQSHRRRHLHGRSACAP